MIEIVSAGLTAASQAIDIAKGLRSLDKAWDQVEVKAKVIDLMDKLQDVRGALQDAREAIGDHEQEIAILRATLAESGNLVAGEGGFKWLLNSSGKKAGYPVCPTCLSRDGRISSLVQNGLWPSVKCPVCAASFTNVEYYETRANGDTVAKSVLEEEQFRSASRTGSRFVV